MDRTPGEGRLVAAPAVGGVVMFCGKHRHAGVATTAGARYILAGFVRVHATGTAGRAVLNEVQRAGAG